MYSNCCCRCSFELEIIKIGQSSHKMYSNNIVNSRVYDKFKFLYKKVWKLIECTMCVCVCVCVCIYIYIYIYIYTHKCTSICCVYVYMYVYLFGLGCFYGKSTVVGYLMPNHVQTYILDIYI